MFELEKIELQPNDLLVYKNFINELGGAANARIALLDIINRYFNSEYVDWELLERGIE